MCGGDSIITYEKGGDLPETYKRMQGGGDQKFPNLSVRTF